MWPLSIPRTEFAPLGGDRESIIALTWWAVWGWHTVRHAGMDSAAGSSSLCLLCLCFMQSEILHLKSQEKDAKATSHVSLKDLEVRSCGGNPAALDSLSAKTFDSMGPRKQSMWLFWALGCPCTGPGRRSYGTASAVASRMRWAGVACALLGPTTFFPIPMLTKLRVDSPHSFYLF